MNLQTLKTFLGWCTVFSYILLMVWSAVSFAFFPKAAPLIKAMFGIDEEKLMTANFYGIMIYKLCVFFLNLVPYLALYMIA